MISDEGRRVEERVTINQEFESLEAFVGEYVANLSHSGAFIKCREPLPVGTKITLRFLVIDEDVEIIACDGEVVRVQNDPPGMGVLFVDLDDETQTLVDRLLSQRAR